MTTTHINNKISKKPQKNNHISYEKTYNGSIKIPSLADIVVDTHISKAERYLNKILFVLSA